MPEEEELNERQERYVLNRLAGRNRTDAYLEAGYDVSRAVARRNASRLEGTPKIEKELKERRERRRELLLEKIETLGEGAVEKLKELIEKGEKEQYIQLSSLKDALDRIGLKPVERQEITTNGKVIIVGPDEAESEDRD